jgi:hypothetical protein
MDEGTILVYCCPSTFSLTSLPHLPKFNVQYIQTKGVGPSTTFAWSGWKQPYIAVEVETARLQTSWFKKCFVNCVLLYYPSTEFKSAFIVYWHGEGAAGLSYTELHIWEFLSTGGE